MHEKVFLSSANILRLATRLSLSLTDPESPAFLRRRNDHVDQSYPFKAFAVPRGGIPALYAVMTMTRGITVTDNPEEADFFVDDIIDSGNTKARYAYDYPGKPFVALIDKTDPACDYKDAWIVFPWESSGVEETSLDDNIVRLLQYIGEDPTREGLLETPHRVAKAWEHWTGGYTKDAGELLKTFRDGSPDQCDEMVVVKDIPVYSKCEHHLADIFGTATVAYIPNGQIVGLSKISRLVDMYARRLQVQERLTNQIAEALQTHLNPLGVGVIIKARHMCMESRGICQQGHYTITSALRGVIKDKPQARAEFMELAK